MSASAPVSALPPVVLSFAVSDPSAATGLQADVMAISGCGCYPATVLCGIGVGDTAGLQEVIPGDADYIDRQARTVLEDMPVDAIKVGQPVSVEAALVLAQILADYPGGPAVLAPESLSWSAREALRGEALEVMARVLLLGIEGDAGIPARLPVPPAQTGRRGTARARPRLSRQGAMGALLAAGMAKGLQVDGAFAAASKNARLACDLPLRLGMGPAVPRRNQDPTQDGK